MALTIKNTTAMTIKELGNVDGEAIKPEFTSGKKKQIKFH